MLCDRHAPVIMGRFLWKRVGLFDIIYFGLFYIEMEWH